MYAKKLTIPIVVFDGSNLSEINSYIKQYKDYNNIVSEKYITTLLYVIDLRKTGFF